MHKPFFFLLLLTLLAGVQASAKDSTAHYALPDSVKAVSFIGDVYLENNSPLKKVSAGLSTGLVTLFFHRKKGQKQVVFSFPAKELIVATGPNVQQQKRGELRWKYDWATGETYKLMVAVAPDSAGNFSLYTGYLWLPMEKKWKLLGSCKVAGQWKTPAGLSAFSSAGKNGPAASIKNIWCRRPNGTWRKMDNSPLPEPSVNLFTHVDSVQQLQTDQAIIERAIAAGQTDATEKIDGVYYKIYQQGSGRRVAVTDTITVHYKGYLFNDKTAMFDQTKEKPARFPLNRLVKAWQIAVPLLNVGGKMIGVMPSALGYSIQTRSPKIPPNSILVFEVEVLEAKPAQTQ